MAVVRDILAYKGSNVVTLAPETTVFDAAVCMNEYGIGAVVVVFDDGAYGNVRRMQRLLYGNRIIASDLRNPDFVRLAESFGVAARQVANPDELADALADALARDQPALLTAKVGEMPDPWSYIHLPRVRG